MGEIDDVTVQQLMNFIGERIAEIDAALPEKHRVLGLAFMYHQDDPTRWAVRSHVEDIQLMAKKRHELSELLSDIDRKRGELHNVKAEETR